MSGNMAWSPCRKVRRDRRPDYYGQVNGSTRAVTEVAMDVVSHGIWGPRRKSWGIEMTILSSIMRGAGQHSSLINLVRATLSRNLGFRC